MASEKKNKKRKLEMQLVKKNHQKSNEFKQIKNKKKSLHSGNDDPPYPENNNDSVIINGKNKKILFDENGETFIPDNKSKLSKSKKYQSQNDQNDASKIGTRWYDELSAYNTGGELVEMKDAEILELTNTCRSCFQNELHQSHKNNPSDAKWLQTALEKGTSKDRANAGALLVQSNPLGNLEALKSLIILSKMSNKTSATAVEVISELFISSLLPPNRKLLSLPLRGADWKALKKNPDLEKSTKDRVLSYWHYETELKDHYFEFLKNVQAAIQGNQDVEKKQAIIRVSKLLCYSPEKEQMLLAMLVNKLGDPSNKVASKALHHLSEVAYKHPAMCTVITMETEKLLFRNNITEHAQHFALCFLSSIAPRGNREVCNRLVQICFSFFKVVVKKGAVNSKTMQAILRCLKRAIVDADTGSSNDEKSGLLTDEIQDTMYRLVHLADIHISLQTLALLLQIMTVKSGKYDRFYNALYKKILDLDLINVGPKAAAQFLHIIHRSIYMDANVPRAQAFIKRLLHVAMYFPSQITCGSLIVVSKLLKSRPELGKIQDKPENFGGVGNATPNDENNDNNEDHNSDAASINGENDNNDDSDTEKIAKTTETESKPKEDDKNDKKSQPLKKRHSLYNANHRSPAFAGAQYAQKLELLSLVRHFHPTVQVFSQNIIDNRPINFYGDPLRDFCLTQFLERFSFRNPKKPDETKSESLTQIGQHRQYIARGSRGKPVQNLTKTNCTEDERFIFEYLEQKREKRAAFKAAEGKKSSRTGGDDDDDDIDNESIDDDEFDAYLDGLGSKKGKGGDGDAEDDYEDDLDFLKDLGDELKEDESAKKGESNRAKKKRKAAEMDQDDDGEFDWDGDDDVDDDDDDDDGGEKSAGLSDDDDSDGSISLDENEEDDIFEGSDDDEVIAGSDDDEDDDDDDIGGIEDDDGDDDQDSDDDDGPPISKKMKGSISDKEFKRKLKNTDDMSSLFAAAEDFSEMLEETGKSKSHGTLGDLFNKDKSSDKQMAWEAKRMESFGGGGGRGRGGNGGRGHGGAGGGRGRGGNYSGSKGRSNFGKSKTGQQKFGTNKKNNWSNKRK